MPLVYGFLRRVRRHGWRPGGPVDPDYGIDEGLHPEVDPPDPDGGDDLEIGGGPIIPNPPPGIWPPLTPEHPWRPIDPGWGQGRPLPPTVGGGPARPPVAPPGVGGGPARPERPVDPDYGIEEILPPGTIWPPLPGGVHGKYLALVLIAGMPGGAKYRYVVVDADARPGRPDNTLPGGEGEAQPKR